MYELNPSQETADAAVRASIEFSEYLRDLARHRRAVPGPDLLSALVQVSSADGDRLTEDELIGTCVLLLNAGHEATVNMTGNGWWSLFRDPAALERWRPDPSLDATAIDELLRFDTPLPLFERWVLEDIEVEGVHIPRGAELALQYAAANRDPDAFADADRLDLARSPNPHTTFGAGIHYCLGAPLARLELRLVFRTLLDRLPRMALLEPPTWKPTYVLRGLEALWVQA